jgi:hypothetical protein
VAGGVRRDLADSGMTPVASVEKIIWGTEHASAAAVGVGASGCYGGASGRGAARWPGDTGGRRCTERRRATGRRVLRSGLQEFCSRPAGCGSPSSAAAEVQA